jgi:DNA-binding NarL/FixJ family response regulator
MAGVRVVLADDHPPTRAGVRSALEEAGFIVVAEASDAPSAVAAAERTRPDVCLLDIHMPGGGIRAATEISTKSPETAVVMLTVSRNDADLFDALRAGASGYLLKDMDPARLPYALLGVLSGEAALPRGLVARLVDEFRARGKRRSLPLIGRRGAGLTSREWEVLELMREKLSTHEIAVRLGVADVTVRRHVGAILHKLRVQTRTEALELLDEEASGDGAYSAGRSPGT